MSEEQELEWAPFRDVVTAGLRQIPRDGLLRLQHELREHPERVLLDGEAVRDEQS